MSGSKNPIIPGQKKNEMAKHIVPHLGEKTYFVWPLFIPTPRWWDNLATVTGENRDRTKAHMLVTRANDRLGRMGIIRGWSVLYDE